MLARSTAWRHGDGRTCTKATSMSSTWPSRTSRLAGLMSRWASPASHSCRTSSRPSSMTSSSTSASPISSRAVEELGDEQVLALGRHLDDAVGRRGRDADVAQEPERVVLVLDEPPDRLERRLVLEPPVEERAAELVPAVGAHVAHRVELPEQVRVGVARDADAAAASSRPSPPGRPASTSSTVSPSWSSTALPDRLARAARSRRGARSCPCGRRPGTPRWA